MKKKLTKKDAKEKIKEFFESSKDKTPKEIKKIKKFSMSYNLPLKEKRKLFCKKCYVFFNSNNSKIRIKKGIKSITCKECNNITKWKLKINSS